MTKEELAALIIGATSDDVYDLADEVKRQGDEMLFKCLCNYALYKEEHTGEEDQLAPEGFNETPLEQWGLVVNEVAPVSEAAWQGVLVAPRIEVTNITLDGTPIEEVQLAGNAGWQGKPGA